MMKVNGCMRRGKKIAKAKIWSWLVMMMDRKTTCDYFP